MAMGAWIQPQGREGQELGLMILWWILRAAWCVRATGQDSHTAEMGDQWGL